MACRPVTTLFLMFFFLFTSSSASRILPSNSQKVSLGLYYESLCPYSANFIVNYLAQLFETDLISVVDLKLVPWGNAKLRGNDTFDCQHGPSECLLNTVEACAIHAWPELLELQYAAETNSLEPPHEYVPWVVVNGEPLYEDYENFVSYICKAYKGTAVLEGCSSVSLHTIQKGKTNPIHPDCFETGMLALTARITSAITSWMQQMNMVASLFLSIY
ncbi:gamma-interferon-responsive lysosomal thiol protein-like isoform X2 [Corylus avellana]|uniref:gamma-interferon-responsive lysosomal thiol protein-like isoform X2 n=1 Tax=Corylus avellana TaxID=13451 RepID=UPI00286D44D8|nr:gamma-interferon-responsive lysosomal thiol protein-like isoform X2 [Corylus avellana]XP_059431176.1 gamma-interferon-responsive lysosomal thiol protein-like isoform X2 [Corylus avellana]